MPIPLESPPAIVASLPDVAASGQKTGPSAREGIKGPRIEGPRIKGPRIEGKNPHLSQLRMARGNLRSGTPGSLTPGGGQRELVAGPAGKNETSWQEKIRAVLGCFQVGELNLQELKQISKLNFSGGKLGPLRLLMEGLSKKEIRELKIEARGLVDLIGAEFNPQKAAEAILNSKFGKTENLQVLGAVVLTVAGIRLSGQTTRKGLIIGGSLLVLLLSYLGPVVVDNVKLTSDPTPAGLAGGGPTAVEVGPTAEPMALETPPVSLAEIIATSTQISEGRFNPADSPPNLMPKGSGGPLTEKYSPSILDAGKYRALYMMATRDGYSLREQGNLEELRADLDNYAKNKGVEVFQTGGGKAPLSLAIRHNPDGWDEIIWMADPKSLLLGVNPNIPPAQEAMAAILEIPYGFDFGAVFNPKDGNYYIIMVDERHQLPVAWFMPGKAYVGSDGKIVGGWHAVDENGNGLNQVVVFGEEGPVIVDESGATLAVFDYEKGRFVNEAERLQERLAADPFNFEAQELAGFVDFGETTIDGTPAIVGIDAQGAEKVLAMELELVDGEKRMVRVSTTEVDGKRMAVYLNPDYDVGDENKPWRVKLTDKAAEVFLLGEYGLLTNLNGKYGQYPGKEGWARLMDAVKNGTPIDIDRLEQPDWAADPLLSKDRSDVWMEWGIVEGVRLDKPVEIVLIDSDERLAKMPQDIQEKVVYQRNMVNPDGSVYKTGYLVSKGKDGHLIVVGLNNRVAEIVKEPLEKEVHLKILSRNIARNVFMANIMLGLARKPEPYGPGSNERYVRDMEVTDIAVGITPQEEAFAFQE